MLAREICESQYVVTGNTKITAQLNAVAGIMEPVVSPYLSNASITGASSKAWYMFSNNVPALEIGFLNGNRTPTVEQADCDFEYLGLRYRCFYDLGVGVADYRGVLKATGEAASSSSSN